MEEKWNVYGKTGRSLEKTQMGRHGNPRMSSDHKQPPPTFHRINPTHSFKIFKSNLLLVIDTYSYSLGCSLAPEYWKIPYTKVKVDGPGGYSIPPWTHQLRLWTTQIFRLRGHLLEAQKRNPRRCAGATNTWRCLCEANTDITWILLMTLLLPELLQPKQRLLLSASIGRRLG